MSSSSKQFEGLSTMSGAALSQDNNSANLSNNIASNSSSLDETKGEENSFSYNALNDIADRDKGMYFRKGDYNVQLSPGAADFICFNFLGQQKNVDSEINSLEARLLVAFALKFHISLPEQDNEKMELSRGWDIVCSILREHQVSFKLARRQTKMSDDPIQSGKIITVYTLMPDKDSKMWQNIFQEVTEQLTKANISPGYRPPGSDEKPERNLNGSNYVTYRYSFDDQNLKYLFSAKVRKKNTKSIDQFINLKNELQIEALKDASNQIIESKDPISKLKINVNNQIDILEWRGNSATLTS